MEDSEGQTMVPCFVCDKAFLRVHESPTQPYGGLVFNAYGNYGSSVFDPFASSESLQILVCDECAEERADRVVAVKETRKRTEFSYRPIASFDEFKDEARLEEEP